MKKPIILSLLLIAILFWNCNNQTLPKTVQEVLRNCIAKSSNANQWSLVTSKSLKITQTTKIGGKTVNTLNMAHYFMHPAYERTDQFIDGALTLSEYHTPDKDILISYNDQKNGYLDIPKKLIFKAPIFKILEESKNLVLSDTLVDSKNGYRLTDTVNNNVYVISHDYLLLAKQTQTGYGRQTETFADYKDVDGYLIATKITRAIPQSGYIQEDIITDIRINPGISIDTFKIDNSKRQIVVGNTLPDFSFIDMDHPENTITNTSLKGKTVLIDFWATWCSPCIKEIPNIQKLYNKYKAKNFEVLSVSIDTQESLVKNFREKRFSLPWKNTILTKGIKDTQAITMEVSAVPKVILVDPEGIIIAIDQDAKGAKLEQVLSTYFNQN